MTIKTLPLFPLGRALFPDGILHLRIFEVRYLDMIRKCLDTSEPFGVVPLLEGKEVRSPEGGEILGRAGTIAKIDEWVALTPTLFQLRCIGTSRFQVQSCEQGQFGLWSGQVAPMADDPIVAIPDTLQASANRLGKLIADLQKDGTPAPAMPIAPPFRLDECGWVANRWCELLPLSPLQQQQMLMQEDPTERLAQIQRGLDSQGLL